MNASPSHCVEFSPTEELLRFAERAYCRLGTLSKRTSRQTLLGDLRKLDRFYASHWCPQARQVPRPLRIIDLDEMLLAAAMRHDVDVDGLEPGTANRLLRNVLAVWRYSAKVSRQMNRRRPESPVIEPPDPELCPKFPEAKREPRCWSMEREGSPLYEKYGNEMVRIFQATKEMTGPLWRKGKRQRSDVLAADWHYANLALFFNTGSRLTALMSTPLSKLDLDAGTVQLPARYQKQNAEQTFDLLPQTVDALAALKLSQRFTSDQRIFEDWIYDRGEGWRTLTDRLKAILRAAGLSCERRDLFHKIRRTFATYLAKSKGVIGVQQWLGHSHPSVTVRYIDKRFCGNEDRINGAIDFPTPPEPPKHPVQTRLPLKAGDLTVFRGDEAEVG